VNRRESHVHAIRTQLRRGGVDTCEAMNPIADRWLLATECFWLAALARANHEIDIATVFIIVGVDWLAGAQERSSWRPNWLARA
jgi:hypothetical protein